MYFKILKFFTYVLILHSKFKTATDDSDQFCHIVEEEFCVMNNGGWAEIL